MKKQLIAIILGATTMLWSNDALSFKKDSGKPTANGGGSNATISAKGANCSPATASITMNFNDVSAFIEQGGSMFQNRQESVAAYEVGGDNLFAIYAGALWMGGTDVNGQLKLAALTFRTGNDFWPGPLTITPGTGNYDPQQPVGDGVIRDFGEANIDPDQCLFYDKFYTIRKAEVIMYTIWWECNNGISLPEDCLDVVSPSDEVLARISAWPAHGRVDLGQDYWLAPFYDYDNDGSY
ncbi:MAG: T9SS C-terminal target domain-containing protein, partial [Crocinitomicaceae bacterium]|nr:T9SS C-terminal target domain-containing protein [Crocinitomicaceae bacterium]